jgi:hypothetical protein
MGLLRRLLIAVAAAVAMAASPAAAERVIAIGDLHGDYAAFLDIVSAAGVSDEKGGWTGDDAILLQLGDVTDRGPDSLKIVRHLQALQAEAPRTGGRVEVLVGNHEAMNVTGDLRYVHPGEFKAFATRQSLALREHAFRQNRQAILARYREQNASTTLDAAHERFIAETPPGMLEHRQAWRPAGELGRWIAARPAIVRIGDTLFVHGGISAETAARPFDEVNRDISARLAEGDTSPQSILTDPLGPLWYRGHVMRDPPAPAEAGGTTAPPRPSIEEELSQVLAAYAAKRLVIAHTPHPAGIVASHDGRLVRIDTGIAAHYGGVRSYLELKDGQATAWSRKGGGKWVSQDLPSPQ